MMLNYRESGYALLRATIGVMFLFYGVGKFVGGIGNTAAGMDKQFAGKLPAALVAPFAYGLPFAEVAIGVLLVFGLLTRIALLLAGLLMLALVFGTVVLTQPQIVANNVMLALVIFVLQWLSDNNGYSLDRLLSRRQEPGANHR